MTSRHKMPLILRNRVGGLLRKSADFQFKHLAGVVYPVSSMRIPDFRIYFNAVMLSDDMGSDERDTYKLTAAKSLVDITALVV